MINCPESLLYVIYGLFQICCASVQLTYNKNQTRIFWVNILWRTLIARGLSSCICIFGVNGVWAWNIVNEQSLVMAIWSDRRGHAHCRGLAYGWKSFWAERHRKNGGYFRCPNLYIKVRYSFVIVMCVCVFLCRCKKQRRLLSCLKEGFVQSTKLFGRRLYIKQGSSNFPILWGSNWSSKCTKWCP